MRAFCTYAAVGFALLFLVSDRAVAQPQLAGTTRIAGERTGFVPVDLPIPLDPFKDPEPGYDLEGSGQVLGAELREVRSDFRQPRSLLVLRVGRPQNRTVLVSAGGELPLPAGRYHLYLITDGPGEVAFQFPTLSGNLSTSPTTSTAFDAGELPVRAGAALGTSVFGRTAALEDRGGLILLRAITDAASAGGGRLELCFYHGGDESAGPFAYGPTCPGGTSTTVTTDPAAGRFTVVFASGGGAYGVGGNFTSLGGRVPLHAYAMWMSYYAGAPGDPGPRDPPPTPPTLSQPLQGMARLAASRVPVRGRRAQVAIQCQSPTRCTGEVRLARAIRKTPFNLSPGQSAKVVLLLRRRLARRIARGARPRLSLVVESTVPGGVRQERALVRLIRPRRQRG